MRNGSSYRVWRNPTIYCTYWKTLLSSVYMMRYCQAIMRNSSNSIEPTVDRWSGGTSAEVDIFLSYFQQNSINQTEMLCIELEKLGIRTWWDKKESNLTEDSMMKAVESCKLFVLFMNRDTLTRDFVCKEVSRALETKKKIVICSECEGEDLSYHGWINEEFRKHVQESWPLKVILRNFGCSRRTPVRRLYKYYKRHDWIDVRFDRADLHGTAQKLLECGRKHGLDLKIQEHPCIYPEEGRHDFFITGNMKDIDTLDACRVLAKLLSWKKRCPCLLDEEGDVDETRIREKLMRSHIFLLLLKNERCIEQRNVQVACKIASELGKNAILVNLEEPFNFKAAQEKAKAELKIDYTNIEFVPFTNRREDFEEATLTMVLRRAAGYATWVEGWDSEGKKTSNEDTKSPVEYSVISFLWRSELEMHQDNFLKYGVRTMADLDVVRCDSSNHKDFDFTSDERKRFENFEIHNISMQSNLHDALHKSFDENFDGLISFDEYVHP